MLKSLRESNDLNIGVDIINALSFFFSPTKPFKATLSHLEKKKGKNRSTKPFNVPLKSSE